MTADTLLPLDMLQAGEWADVADVAGEPGMVCRMAELGVRIGCRLRMLQGGCPCLLQVEGFPQRLPWVLVHLPTPLSPAAEAFKQHLLEYRGKLESLRGPGGG